MYFGDATYILVLIGVVIVLFAQSKLKTTFAKYRNKQAACGLTGAEVAKRILQNNGIYDVSIQPISGDLTDNYNPSNKTLNLSQSVCNATSLVAISVAAHECGHAIQDNESYGALKLRSSIYPVVNIGSKLSWPLIFVGVLLGGMYDAGLGSTLMEVGIFAFLLTVLFQLITLPVEFNASDRAMKQLAALGLMADSEHSAVKSLLSAAAMTYVASAISGILQLLRLVILFGGGRNRRD